jgi:hypothetical protein
MDSLKSEILELLDKDKEFRYAIAGYLGLWEILKKFDDLVEGQRRLVEEQVRLAKEQSKLREDFGKLVEEQVRLAKEQSKLREDFGKLVEEQVRLAKEQSKLREDFGQMYAQFSKRFEEHDRKFNEVALELRSLRREVGGIGETLGILVEDYTLEKFEGELRRRGLVLEEIRSMEIEGMEVDAVFRDEEVIVLEVKSTIRGDDVRDLARKRELVERTIKKPARAIIAGIRVNGAAEDMARNLGIEVLRRFPRRKE